MKITINKEYTSAAQFDTIKEKAREFKARLTDGDLLRMFNESTDDPISGEIIKCAVEAFAADNWSDVASYHATLIIDGLIEFHRIRFFIDEKDGCYNVNTDEILLTHETYHIA